jgi:HEAT repeat protein
MSNTGNAELQPCHYVKSKKAELELCAPGINKFVSTLRIILLLFLLLLSSCCEQEKIPQLISKLYSAESTDRNDAALALARCGEKADRAVPRLRDLLYDPNVGVQSAASYALRKIDTPAARRAIDQAVAARDAR